MTIYQTGAKVVTSLTGAERVGVDTGGALIAVTSAGTLAGLSNIGASSYVTNTSVANTTLTVGNVAPLANVAGGGSFVVLNLTGTLTGAATATLPSVAQVVGAVAANSVGLTYQLRIINSSSGAYAWTIAAGAGWTLSGTMTIAQNTWREFIVTLTSASAGVVQSVGTGTYS
jgi:hypothetical protein